MSKCSLFCSLVILQAFCCWLVAGGNSSQVFAAASSEIRGASVYLQDLSLMSRRARDEFIDGGIGDFGDEDLAGHGAAPQPEGEAPGHGAAPQPEGEADAGVDVDVDDSGGGRSGEVECQVCHKRFKNDKSMFGHLRSHPNRGYKGATPPLKISSTPSSPPLQLVGDTPPLLSSLRPVHDSNCSMSMSDISLSTYEQLAACVMVTLRHRYGPGRLQPQAAPPLSPSCSNKRKHESIEQAAAGAGELATSIMEGAACSSAVLHDHEAQRKGKRKLKVPGEAERRVKDVPSRKEKRRPYMCKHCNEEFSTHQALGGHMAGHHKEKRILKEKELARSLLLEEQPERSSLILKEKQPERGLILEEKQPERNLALKEKQPERSLALKEKQPEVFQDKIDQTMNRQEMESGVFYLGNSSNTVLIAEDDRRPLFGFDLNVEAPEQE